MAAFASFACLLLLSFCFVTVEARYLPTRSGNTEDRISKLKELLRDVSNGGGVGDFLKNQDG
ncbi:hypothetical protein WDU94_005048 [Cyamophila willieti]